MRTLVTGGAGFIGSQLVDALVAGGHEVVVLDDLSTGYEANINPGATLIVGDVADLEKVQAAVEGAEVVYHLAAARAVLRSVHEPLATDRSNTAGTLTVLEAARQAGVPRVVSTSSSSVYGGAEMSPTPESAPLLPRSPYAVAKLAGEHYARVYWELHGVETVSFRLFNVFGPRQRPDNAYAAVIPIFIDALRTGSEIQIHGDGKQSRDFTYIDNVVGAYLAAGTAAADRCAGHAYNIGVGESHSLLDLLAHLERMTGTIGHVTHVDSRAGDVRRSCADCSAAIVDLDWEPKVGFEEGLERTVAWFSSR